MEINIPSAELDAWIAELKPYQRAILTDFLKTEAPEKVAERWLTTTGSPNLVAFGGVGDPKPFWERFRTEFDRFLCDESAYVEERKALLAEGSVSKAMLISIVASALGATLGFAATLLAPAVTLLLYLAGKIGIAAYCASRPKPDAKT